MRTTRALVLTVLVLLVGAATAPAASASEAGPGDGLELDHTAVHRLTARVELYVGNDDLADFIGADPAEFGFYHRCEARCDYLAAAQRTVEIDLPAGDSPFGTFHDPNSTRRSWWRGPFSDYVAESVLDPHNPWVAGGPDGVGLRVFDSDAETSICFANQAAEYEVFEGGNEIRVRTTVGAFNNEDCSDSPVATRQLSVTAPPDGRERCGQPRVDPDIWEYHGNDVHAEAVLCVTNERIDPVARAVPVSGNVGPAPFRVVWDGSYSRADGGVAAWRWDFGDGSTLNGGPEASHTYLTPGQYTVHLTIIDSHGRSHTAAVGVVTVHAPPTGPIATITGPTATQQGSTVSFDASGSRPASGRGGAIAEYRWDFGDGSQSITPSWQPNMSHTYTAPGVFTVMVEVHTADGKTARAYHQILVIAHRTVGRGPVFISL